MIGRALRALAAIPMSLLPARLWDDHPDLPLFFGAAVSGLITLALGIIPAVVAFFQHLIANASNLSEGKEADPRTSVMLTRAR